MKKELILSEDRINILKKYIEKETEIDECAAYFDIEAISKAQDFIIDNWDICLRNIESDIIKSILIGLHCAKRNIKELFE